MPTDYAGAQGLDGRWSGGESWAAIVLWGSCIEHFPQMEGSLQRAGR